MTQSERLDILLEYLLEEDPKYSNISIPAYLSGKKELFERLMKIRPISSFSKEFRMVYTEYLQEEKDRHNIVSIDDLTPIQPHIYLWYGKNGSVKADALVIEDSRKMEEDLLNGTLQVELNESELPYQHIILQKGVDVNTQITRQQSIDLQKSLWNSFEEASKKQCRSVAISASDLNLPTELSAHIAIDTLSEYFRKTRKHLEVIFNVSKEADYQIYHRLLSNRHL